MLKTTWPDSVFVTVAPGSLFRIFSSFVSATYAQTHRQSRLSSEFWCSFIGPAFSTKPGTIFVFSVSVRNLFFSFKCYRLLTILQLCLWGSSYLQPYIWYQDTPINRFPIPLTLRSVLSWLNPRNPFPLLLDNPPDRSLALISYQKIMKKVLKEAFSFSPVIEELSLKMFILHCSKWNVREPKSWTMKAQCSVDLWIKHRSLSRHTAMWYTHDLILP